ncbi:MAG TPA: molybdopterin cofactor-binding domain-containing protein, partial [Pseudomonadales bacterium]|nr:molybdopterin cofactor-binding domain-containing protein [Pseudomonadales bacterium]
AAKKLQSDFIFPYLAHAPMEPLNVVINYTGGNSCEIWCGSQWPDGDRAAAASALGISADKITFHNMLSGGGFGRRASPDHDFVVEAARLAKVLKKPVKVVWTREDDIQGGYYRPCAVSRLTGSLDSQGNVTSITGRIATQSVYGSALVENAAQLIGEDIRAGSGLQDQPYSIPNVRVDVHYMKNKVPVMWMRSVASSFNVYALETFIDELAYAAGKDPYQFRRAMLQDKPRLVGVLDAVAQASGWSSQPPTGVHRGIAVVNYNSSYLAQVVEASVSGKKLTINKVFSAVDCGIAVNPDLVKAQIESGIVFGLSSVVMGAITFDKGDVQQSNFNDYPILRMNQAPAIETQIVNSGEAPGGVGELGVPAIGPALANAIFAATGKRIRNLPMADQNLNLL